MDMPWLASVCPVLDERKEIASILACIRGLFLMLPLRNGQALRMDEFLGGFNVINVYCGQVEEFDGCLIL